MPTYTPLHLAAAEAVAARAGVPPAELKVEAPPRPELGDLAVGCFAIGKATNQNPAKCAAQIAADFQPTELLERATATGPFVNFHVARPAGFRWVIDSALRGTLVPSAIGAGETICIDYSSPNISKHLAYHHIRGTTLGHSLVKLNRALGYRVVGINFLGDWGTTHGMLLAAWSRWGEAETRPLDITVLNELYVKYRRAMEANPALESEARDWFKRLEGGDPEARALWQRFRDVSWAEFQDIYDILGIEFEEVRGESEYEPALAGVMRDLTDKGLVTTSEGAQVAELPGEKTPILLRKQDGTTLYATRDVAAAQYHWERYHFAKKLYVVDRGQALHFRQLFKLLAKAGHAWAGVFQGDKLVLARCDHVQYGLIRLGGKKTGTRLANVVLMRDVFHIMESEVRPRIAERNPERSAEEIDAIARMVGIGAVVFGNLATQREKDIDFDIEKVTSTEGDSGPYLQYSHARCASIVRRAGEQVTSVDGIDLALLTHDAEWAVAKRLLDFADAVVRAARESEPHAVCHYLLQLASDFSRWYTLGNGDPALRIVCEHLPTRRARLALTAAVQATMASGLAYLGIGAPDWM